MYQNLKKKLFLFLKPDQTSESIINFLILESSVLPFFRLREFSKFNYSTNG